MTTKPTTPSFFEGQRVFVPDIRGFATVVRGTSESDPLTVDVLADGNNLPSVMWAASVSPCEPALHPPWKAGQRVRLRLPDHWSLVAVGSLGTTVVDANETLPLGDIRVDFDAPHAPQVVRRTHLQLIQTDEMKDIDPRAPSPETPESPTAIDPDLRLHHDLRLYTTSRGLEALTQPSPRATKVLQTNLWTIIELRDLPDVESLDISECGRAIFLELSHPRLGGGPIPMVMIIDLRLDHPHGLWSSEILPDRQGVNLVLRRHP